MSTGKAKEIAREAVKNFDSVEFGASSLDLEVAVAERAVNLALEWAAQQCEAEAPFANSDQSLIANACAERIRAGKSGRPA